MGKVNVKKGTKGFVSRPIEERFWEKVQKSDDCWLWTGTKRQGGYGSIHHNGRERVATHVSWELANGMPWPEGMLACHRCDNPPCVRPDHLFIGDSFDNMRDAVKKGRTNSPFQNPGHVNWQVAKTHCKTGHEFTPDNTYIYPNGQRACRACAKARWTRYNKVRPDRADRRARKAALAQVTKLLGQGGEGES